MSVYRGEIMIYIKFANQTYGEKAAVLLKHHKIKSVLKRNPNPNHKEGCNFALFCEGNIYTAFEIINSNAIPNLGVESFGGVK